MSITQQEFEKLPREIQNLRWKLFEVTNGHQKDPLKSNNYKLVQKVLNVLYELKKAGDTVDRDNFLKLYDRFLLLQRRERKQGRLKN